MEDSSRQLICCATASALMLLLLGDAEAQKSQLLQNVELCNGADRTSPDIQIDGCSALIDSGEQTPQALVIAYNNRGNAYTTLFRSDGEARPNRREDGEARPNRRE